MLTKSDQKIISLIMLIVISISSYYCYLSIKKFHNYRPITSINYGYNTNKFSAKTKSIELKSSPAQDSSIAKIDLNSADQTELISLPGIGKAIAGRIITYRETNGKFQHLIDLKKVSGIGEKKFQSIFPLLKKISSDIKANNQLLVKETAKPVYTKCINCQSILISANSRKKIVNPYCKKCLQYQGSNI